MRRREQESEHPGETVGSYEIREQLGSGGMGVVFRALDRRLNRPVALKFLPASVGADAQLRQRFFQEAQAAASLDHASHVLVQRRAGRLGIEGSAAQVARLADGSRVP